MIKYSILLITLWGSFPILSQLDEVEEELKILYAEEKYEKCANKALKLADKKERNNPIVYLYASKACLKMSQTHDLRLKYPKAFNDALKYAGKYQKYDKSGRYYEVYIDHFEELKEIVLEDVQNYLLTYTGEDEIKGAKKGVSLIKQVNKFAPQDQGAWLLRGVLELKRKNTLEGGKMIKIHLEAIKHLSIDSSYSYTPKRTDEVIEIKAFNKMSAMEQILLKKSLIAYAEYLVKKNKKEEALQLLEIGKPFFYKENEEIEFEYTTDFKKAYLMVENT